MQSAHADASERSEAKQHEPARLAPTLPLSPAAREVTAPPAPAARPSDSELPIAQSVEPPRTSNGSRARVAPALPVLVDQVRRTTKRVSGEVRALVARSPRAAIVVALTAFVLLGVAIGYAAANKSTDATTSGEAGGQLEDQRLPLGTGGDADSLRALTSHRDSASRRAASASTRRTTSGVRRSPRNGSRGVAPAPVTTEPGVTEPPAANSVAAPPVTPSAAAASAGDSAAVPSRDSAAVRTAPAVSTARTDSLVAEREALRLELRRRQARLDSIARRVQELKPDQR